MSKQAQQAEREARQRQIDEIHVEPVWSPHVDIPILEKCLACGIPKSPIILLPELRIKSLLLRLLERFDGTGKFMIVDETNARFESLRACAQNTTPSFYYSAQDAASLNYADDIFHFAITEVGLSTLARAGSVLPVYRRVLRPNGYLYLAAPVTGSFPQFLDIFEECLFRLNPGVCRKTVDDMHAMMHPEAIARTFEHSRLSITAQETVSFQLEFPGSEKLLFSTLVESHYLGYCLNIMNPAVDSKSLLTLIIRAFHHYYQGAPITVPMNVAIFSAQKV